MPALPHTMRGTGRPISGRFPAMPEQPTESLAYLNHGLMTRPRSFYHSLSEDGDPPDCAGGGVGGSDL